MSNIRTVSDTKRAFYAVHTRPISSIYRRIVEELMVEMHLLSVNVDFRYDPIYALGVVSTFDRFMQGYRPEQDVASVFSALCRAMEDGDPERYRRDAEQFRSEVAQLSESDLEAITAQAEHSGGVGLQSYLNTIAKAQSFKYSRLFAIGLLTTIEVVDESIVSDEDKLKSWVQKMCELLHLPQEKMEKDLEIYRGNLEKFRQAQAVMEDVLKADRKKREERQTAASESSDTSSEDSSSNESVSDSAPDGEASVP